MIGNLIKPKTNVMSFILQAMNVYVQEAKKLSVQHVEDIVYLRNKYNSLCKLGMGQTQNAKSLLSIIQQNNLQQEDKSTADNLIRFIKCAQTHFGSNTFLVSNAAFKELCKKYELTTGLLSDYNGVIPNRNIEDIANAADKIGSFKFKNLINKAPKGFLLKVSSVSIPNILNTKDSNIKDFLKRFDYTIAVSEYKPNYDGAWWPVNCIDAVKGKDYDYDTLTKIRGTIVKKDTMFIACPKKYLNNPEITVTKQPVDPVVFQYTPYGILIHTVWGEEAEDAVLNKFMEFNNSL